MHRCKSPSVNRYYFVLSAVLFILQYFWLYFAIFCSAMKKNFSEKVVARTFLATEVIFIVVLTLMTSSLWWAIWVQTIIILPALWAGFKILLWNKFAWWSEKLWRYREIWVLRSKKRNKVCTRHCQMVTHVSTQPIQVSNPIRRGLTPRTRLLDHRSIHTFANISVRKGLIPWTGR